MPIKVGGPNQNVCLEGAAEKSDDVLLNPKTGAAAVSERPLAIRDRIWANPARPFNPGTKTFVQFGIDTSRLRGDDRVSQHTRYAAQDGCEHNRVLVEPDPDGSTIRGLVGAGLINDFSYAVSAENVRENDHIRKLLNAANHNILNPTPNTGKSSPEATVRCDGPRTYTDMDHHHRILSVENQIRKEMGGVPRFPGVNPPSKSEQEEICKQHQLPVPRSVDPKEYTQSGGVRALEELGSEIGVTKPKGDGCNGLAISIVTKENVGAKLEEIGKVTDYDGASLGGITIQEYMDPEKYQEGLVVVAADLEGSAHVLAVGQEIVSKSPDGQIKPLIGLRYPPSEKFKKQVDLIGAEIQLYEAKGTVAFGQFWADKENNITLGEVDVRIPGSYPAINKILDGTLQEVNMRMQQGMGCVVPKWLDGMVSSSMAASRQQRDKLQQIINHSYPRLNLDSMEKAIMSQEAKKDKFRDIRVQVSGPEDDVEKFSWDAARVLKNEGDLVFAPGISDHLHGKERSQGKSEL